MSLKYKETNKNLNTQHECFNLTSAFHPCQFFAMHPYTVIEKQQDS